MHVKKMYLMVFKNLKHQKDMISIMFICLWIRLLCLKHFIGPLHMLCLENGYQDFLDNKAIDISVGNMYIAKCLLPYSFTPKITLNTDITYIVHETDQYKGGNSERLNQVLVILNGQMCLIQRVLQFLEMLSLCINLKFSENICEG